MRRIIVLVSVLFTLICCNDVNLKQTCIGEWSYIVGDTAYCELLIDGSKVYPYHNGELNSYAYPYKIKNDTFYIYGNESDIMESSPIKYLGKDSFQIAGITPAVLHRISYEEAANNSLEKYRYRLKQLTSNRTITEIYEQGIFPEIEAMHKIFEADFKNRRFIALYKINKKGRKNIQYK